MEMLVTFCRQKGIIVENSQLRFVLNESKFKKA